MTNWEWFAPALTFLGAMALWVLNRVREDRHRFTKEKRTLYAEFIRAQTDCAGEAGKVVALREWASVSDAEPGRDYDEEIGQAENRLDEAAERRWGAMSVLMLIAPIPVISKVLLG